MFFPAQRNRYTENDRCHVTLTIVVRTVAIVEIGNIIYGFKIMFLNQTVYLPNHNKSNTGMAIYCGSNYVNLDHQVILFPTPHPQHKHLQISSPKSTDQRQPSSLRSTQFSPDPIHMAPRTDPTQLLLLIQPSFN